MFSNGELAGTSFPMAQAEFQPGDKVIELAALTRSSAMITGAVLSEAAAWLLKFSISLCLGLLAAGVAAGWLIGMLAGRCLYPAAAGKAVVVQAGGSALPAAWKAALSGALLASAVVGLAFSSLTLAPRPFVMVVSLGIGAMIGLVSGLLAAYL